MKIEIAFSFYLLPVVVVAFDLYQPVFYPKEQVEIRLLKLCI